jgi:hypothetical protein
MTELSAAAPAEIVPPYKFESFGVKVEIGGNNAVLVEQVSAVARKALLNNVREIGTEDPDHRFEVNRTPGGTYILIKDGRRIASGRSRKKFIQLVDSMICVAVGEYAHDLVFMHAGVVGWRGKAIIIPANSFQGKTTLVAELVRNGGTYYSDEFAIFDREGLVHPFARPLSMRTRSQNGKLRAHELTPELLGGTYGTQPIPVGTVLITEYVPNARWAPKILTPGSGVLQMMPHTMPLRHRPDFTLHVLNKIASHAIIASSPRGSAERFAKTLFKFIDNHVN